MLTKAARGFCQVGAFSAGAILGFFLSAWSLDLLLDLIEKTGAIAISRWHLMTAFVLYCLASALVSGCVALYRVEKILWPEDFEGLERP